MKKEFVILMLFFILIQSISLMVLVFSFENKLNLIFSFILSSLILAGILYIQVQRYILNYIDEPVKKIKNAMHCYKETGEVLKLDIKSSDLQILVKEFQEFLNFIHRKTKKDEATYLATVMVLANTIDAKDKYTHGHSKRVADYCIAVAKQLGFSKVHIRNLQIGALLHDIGKIGIKDEIIKKTTKLTEEEYQEIKAHPSIGAEIVSPVDFLFDKMPMIKHHHEKYDGTGYPDGLKGDEIPIEARIISIADAYDAITSERPYRKGLSHKKAVEELKRGAGTQFDPEIVKVFLSLFEE